jgi:hypothetical protein
MLWNSASILGRGKPSFLLSRRAGYHRPENIESSGAGKRRCKNGCVLEEEIRGENIDNP